MKERKINQHRISTPTQDGAGVKLSRVHHRSDTLDLDPFLMLDTFDSANPSDYLKGFPIHPHRGIETFTYLIEGEILHGDSLGNKGAINSGEYQWMRSGSGILHEEMPQASDQMLAYQLWINMPKAEKMSDPSYMDGNKENIPVVENADYQVRVLSGEFGGKTKTKLPAYVEVELYDIILKAGRTIEVPTNPEHNVIICMLRGYGTIDGQTLAEKAVCNLTTGDIVKITAGDKDARIEFFAGKPLNEPIAWSGPIVMNTQQELEIASRELREGTFIKHNIAGNPKD